MEKKTVSGYSRRIKAVRETLNLKIAEFARSLDVPRSTLIGWEEGKTVSIEILKPLETIFAVNMDWLLTGEGSMFLNQPQNKAAETLPKAGAGYKIPLLNQRVSCGAGADWENEQNIERYIDVFSLVPGLRLERLFALSVRGNSMVGAGIRSGDYVLFGAEEDQRLKDDIYVFSLDGEVFCKLLEFDRISKRIKIYSVRVADIEKAELLETLDIEADGFNDRFHIYGRVFSWIHPNLDDA